MGMNRTDAEDLLRLALANPRADFRPGQWEAIDALVNQRRKLLVIERTGWGKSSVYFISTRVLRDCGSGPTLIVSPLLALMRNQIEAAERLRIRAVTINSTNRDAWQTVYSQILGNRVDAVLISPERLSNEGFVEKILLPLANRIGLFVVDEAHCISDWGHDFRPDYRRMVNVLRQMPAGMPVLATTATANNRVVRDVQEQLGDIAVQRGPLVRESLVLQTLRLPDQAARLGWLAEHLPKLSGTGIVYVLTKRDAEQVCGWLNQSGIVARPYYSDVSHPDFADSNAYRLALEDDLLRNRIKVLVATTALGMGYDKPDIGFVVHFQAPGSVVAYYQQVGRAGRAIEQAYGVLLSGREDDEIHQFFRRSAFPDETHVQQILQTLEQHEGLSIVDLQRHVNLTQGQIDKVLKYVSVENPAPLVKQGSQWHRTAVRYRLDLERIRRLTEQRDLEWRQVQDYIGTTECLMSYLRRALDDPEAEPCGRCANCLGRPILDGIVPRERGIAAAGYLRQADMPLPPRAQVASNAFSVYGLRGNLPQTLRAREGRVLSRWGDAGWGQAVKEDKHGNHFRDELVKASTELVRERWRPEPVPRWVTCVPSRRHPELVPGFARRLAHELDLPFHAVVNKARDNEPQKLQQNRFHQCRNLDGAFHVRREDIPTEPVLLVDDLVDSGWTFTVVAALLQQAGSGPVFPFALATTSAGD